MHPWLWSSLLVLVRWVRIGRHGSVVLLLWGLLKVLWGEIVEGRVSTRRGIPGRGSSQHGCPPWESGRHVRPLRNPTD